MAIQADLLGAAALGIRNVLCLSGYHQSLCDCAESANVYDIDSVQLLSAVKGMNEKGILLNGTKIAGGFAMTAGAAVNPFLRPMELNMLRMANKIAAGAVFFQTHAVFDIAGFEEWLAAAAKEELTDKAAILAGVMPLKSAAEARDLRERFTDFVIPDEVVARLEAAGGEDKQAEEGIQVCVDIIKKLKEMKGLRGIHILSGGNEGAVGKVISGAGL
jgi:methylenetetrahydrofolate reductase (NADPH)